MIIPARIKLILFQECNQPYFSRGGGQVSRGPVAARKLSPPLIDQLDLSLIHI